MENGAIHTIEHLVATFLRSHELWQDKVIYLGRWVAAPDSINLSW